MGVGVKTGGKKSQNLIRHAVKLKLRRGKNTGARHGQLVVLAGEKGAHKD